MILAKNYEIHKIIILQAYQAIIDIPFILSLTLIYTIFIWKKSKLQKYILG